MMPLRVVAVALVLVGGLFVSSEAQGGSSSSEVRSEDYYRARSTYGGYGSKYFGGYGASRGGFSSYGNGGDFFGRQDYPDEREVYPEWFDVDDPEDCENVPDTVNTGRPGDLCDGANVGERFCLCVKRRRYSPGGGRSAVYQPICGECKDPCALRFIPDKYPKRTNTKKNNDNDEN